VFRIHYIEREPMKTTIQSIERKGKLLGFPEIIIHEAVKIFVKQEVIAKAFDIYEEAWLEQALYDVSNEEQRSEILRNVTTAR